MSPVRNAISPGPPAKPGAAGTGGAGGFAGLGGRCWQRTGRIGSHDQRHEALNILRRDLILKDDVGIVEHRLRDGACGDKGREILRNPRRPRIRRGLAGKEARTGRRGLLDSADGERIEVDLQRRVTEIGLAGFPAQGSTLCIDRYAMRNRRHARAE